MTAQSKTEQSTLRDAELPVHSPSLWIFKQSTDELQAHEDPHQTFHEKTFEVSGTQDCRDQEHSSESDNPNLCLLERASIHLFYKVPLLVL